MAGHQVVCADFVWCPAVIILTAYNIIAVFQERDIGDEYGWKQVHGDVFRTPSNPILFSALIGTGYQLATVALGCIMIELTGHLYMQ